MQQQPLYPLTALSVQQQATFGLNSAGLSPAMNAAAATLFCSQFGQPQPDDESSSKLLLSSIPAAS
jgi:hypothetical protein